MNAANKAWYWLAAGVLALGLNGYYQDGGLQGLHRLANCTETRVAEGRVQFSQMATVAEGAMVGPARLHCERSAPIAVVAASPSIPPQAQARLAQLQERLGEMQVARVQARIAGLQQVMAQRELQRAQVEWQDGRISVVDDLGRVQVALPPLPRVEISVPQVSAIEATPN
jgi:hypothetical protein